MVSKIRPIKVIYISGIGRSGSTLIDVIISTCSSVFSVGEIYKYNSLLKSDIYCACGKRISQCTFWTKVKEDNFFIKNRMNLLDYFKIFNYLFNPFSKKISFSFSDNYELFSSILDLSPKKTIYLLDSSKDLGRLIELESDPRFQVFNINVIRDGRAVATSFNSTRGTHGKSYFVSLFKWILMNSLIFRYQKKNRSRRLNVNYEYFSSHPDEAIREIQKFLKIKIPSSYTKLIPNMNYHNIGGNRLILKENRANFHGVNLDNRWKTEKSKLINTIASIIVYPFNSIWLK